MTERSLVGVPVRVVVALLAVASALLLSERQVKRRYIERVKKMDVPEEADQQILTYPLA